jgi:hypothetical protein
MKGVGDGSRTNQPPEGISDSCPGLVSKQTLSNPLENRTKQ